VKIKGLTTVLIISMLAWSCSNALIETPNGGFQPHSVETPVEGQTRSVAGGYGSDVMLQGFHWGLARL
jgi:hypothetical protein